MAGHRALAATRRDPWDEDDAADDEEYGPSWTKAYVGGMKVRQYAAAEVEAAVRLAAQQPGVLVSPGGRGASRRAQGLGSFARG